MSINIICRESQILYSLSLIFSRVHNTNAFFKTTSSSSSSFCVYAQAILVDLLNNNLFIHQVLFVQLLQGFQIGKNLIVADNTGDVFAIALPFPVTLCLGVGGKLHNGMFNLVGIKDLLDSASVGNNV